MRATLCSRLPTRPTRRHQRGVAAVELGILMPLLMFLSLAMADYGRYIYTYNTLLKAVHSATRHLAMNDFVVGNAARDAVRTEALNLALYGELEARNTPLVPGLTASMVTVCTTGCPPSVPALYTFVSVRISGYRYTPMLGVLWGSAVRVNDISSTMRGKTV